MPSRNRCPRCLKRRPHRGIRCNGCGAALDGSKTRGRRLGLWLVALATITAAMPFAVGHADRFIPAISEWYMDVAVPNAVKPSRNLVAAPAAESAFEACARRAAKESSRSGAHSVLTFSPEAESIVTKLDEDLLIISSTFEELGENGERKTGEFCCAVRREGEAWRVESLSLRRLGEGERAAALEKAGRARRGT